jgi:hypothetical protein
MFVPHGKHVQAVDFAPHGQHAYRPAWPVTVIALLFLYAVDIHASQETHLQVSTACYRKSSTSLYAVDVRTSQETHLQVSTACCRKSSTFYMQLMFAPHRKHSYRTPRPVTRLALLYITLHYCAWLIKCFALKACGGWDEVKSALLTLAPDTGQWSVSHPRPL